MDQRSAPSPTAGSGRRGAAARTTEERQVTYGRVHKELKSPRGFSNPRSVISGRYVTTVSAGRRRSVPADDPLSSERTRWLSDAVGGGGRLAAMLGVSASQTSRWASGRERPGVEVAPLLIDLEHVLARVRLVWAEPAATTWLTSANAHLGGALPLAVLQADGPGPVLMALDAGAWGSAA